MTLAGARTLGSVTLWQRFASGQGMTVLLTALVLLSVSWPIQQARWVAGMAPLSLIAMLGLALWLATDAAGWPSRWAHLLSAAVGLAITAVAAMAVATGSYPFGRAEGVIDDVRLWFSAIPSDDLVPGRIEFVILMISVFWSLGFWGSWFALRRRQPWPLVLVVGLVLILALANLASGASFWLVTFMGLSLVLLVHVTTIRRQDLWRSRGMEFAPFLALSHSVFILGFGFVAMLLAAVVPSMPWVPLDSLGQRLASATDSFESGFGRLFNGLPSRQSYITLTYGEETLFRGNPNLTDEVIFRVSGPRNYWRARTYTEYSGTGWSTGDAAFHEPGPEITQDDARRVDVQNSFRIDSATDSLFTAGLPGRFDAPARYLHSGDTPWDVLQVRYGQGLDFFKTRLNLSYTSRGSVSVASDGELRAAEGPYPEWVTKDYLQLPDELPARVGQLAREVGASATGNSYDQAIAIRDFLIDYRYNLSISAPPEGSDGVDHFLFTSREGYCDYYASSMAVMLRAVGIPSRYVLGYAPGGFDAGRSEHVVRELNYHSWPEAYISGHGWIAFEPTPPNAIEFGGVVGLGLLDLTEGGTPLDDLFAEEEFPPGVAGVGGSSGADTSLVVPIVLGLGLLLLGMAGAIYYQAWWRLSRLERSAELFGKMQRLGTMLGTGPRLHQTPREYGWVLARQMPAYAWAVFDISEAYTAYRYGHRMINISQRANAEFAWGRLRWALVKRLLRPGR